jgi:peroxiredoxin Q/BCP
MAAKKSASSSATPALEGKRAPAFELADSAGATVKLDDLIGKGGLVLYFYPKDMTPGCTREACGFQDLLARIDKSGAQVAGVSGDSPESHRKFASKYKLGFRLLSDPDHRVAKLYGVWKKKSLYGREFMGIERTTFVIDRAGVIRRVFPKVKVDGHPQAVLEALSDIG